MTAREMLLSCHPEASKVPSRVLELPDLRLNIGA